LVQIKGGVFTGQTLMGFFGKKWTHVGQGCTNPGGLKYYGGVPNVCRSSAWNLLDVILLAPGNFQVASRLLEKLCTRDGGAAVCVRVNYALFYWKDAVEVYYCAYAKDDGRI